MHQDPDSHLAGWRAQLDQMTAGLSDLAHLVGAYARALEEEGFARTEALELAAHYQMVLLTMGSEDEAS